MILAAQAFVAVPKSLSRIHGMINDAAAAAALLRPTHVQFFAQFLPLSPFWPAFGHFGRANGELSFKPAMPHFFLKKGFRGASLRNAAFINYPCRTMLVAIKHSCAVYASSHCPRPHVPRFA